MQLASWDSYYLKATTFSSYITNLLYHWPYLWQMCLKAKESALEVGCGRGLHSVFLSYFTPLVIGIDNNIKIIKKARKNNTKFHGRARFIQRDAFEIGFQTDKFDMCFSQGFLEHFTPNEIRLLIYKQLNISKVVVASVPSAFYEVRDRGDEYLLSIDQWRKILRDFDTRMFYYGFKPRESSSYISAKNLCDMGKLLHNKSYRLHICIVVKRAIL